MKKFIKRMRNNNSYFPSDHIHPLQILENMNHPMIPKLISYDNYAYTCEHIEGLSLAESVRKNKGAAFALKVVQDINNFMYDLTKFTKVNEKGWKLQFSCDDIHEANIIVTEDGKPYIIDFDQFGYYPSYTIFKLLQSTNYRLCDSIRSALLLSDTDRARARGEAAKKRIAELEEQLLNELI
jgi:thiamine kinase-like enzyme